MSSDSPLIGNTAFTGTLCAIIVVIMIAPCCTPMVLVEMLRGHLRA